MKKILNILLTSLLFISFLFSHSRQEDEIYRLKIKISILEEKVQYLESLISKNSNVKGTYSKDWNEVHLPLLYSDYYVVVFAEKAGNFSLLSTVSDYVIPRPGNSGQPSDSGSRRAVSENSQGRRIHCLEGIKASSELIRSPCATQVSARQPIAAPLLRKLRRGRPLLTLHVFSRFVAPTARHRNAKIRARNDGSADSERSEASAHGRVGGSKTPSCRHLTRPPAASDRRPRNPASSRGDRNRQPGRSRPAMAHEDSRRD